MSKQVICVILIVLQLCMLFIFQNSEFEFCNVELQWHCNEVRDTKKHSNRAYYRVAYCTKMQSSVLQVAVRGTAGLHPAPGSSCGGAAGPPWDPGLPIL